MTKAKRAKKPYTPKDPAPDELRRTITLTLPMSWRAGDEPARLRVLEVVGRVMSALPFDDASTERFVELIREESVRLAHSGKDPEVTYVTGETKF